MSADVKLNAEKLRAVPLFRNITTEHLDKLITAFKQVRLEAGATLFKAGQRADDFLLLAAGEIELRERGEPRFLLKPLAAIGELGALTGGVRNVTAVASEPSTVYRIDVGELRQFFEAHGDIAFPCYHNLLAIVGDKLRRDRTRSAEMRDNLVRTQKAMKALRDKVLEQTETPISSLVVDKLESLIEQNRRGHYLVEPGEALPATIKLDDGARLRALALSEGWIRVEVQDGLPALGKSLTAVLVLPEGEVPITATVDEKDETNTPASVLLRLDPLIESYQAQLRDYLTRVQMLDYVV